MFNNLRIVHGWIYEKSAPLRGMIKSFCIKEQKVMAPVDFVVTWVDGGDLDWQKEKEQYQNADKLIEGNDISRYREWGLFKYWFRAVEKYAPWVDHVYLVTCGHVPDWINLDAPKLKVVKHSDFMPEKYLPTFSSIPIELNLWRIKGLNELFVYFNDDVYLCKPTTKETFFSGDLPKYTAIAKPIINYSNSNYHIHQQFGDIGIINKNFNVKKSMVLHPEKWFSHKYKKGIKYNKRAFSDGFLTGMEFAHLGCPFKKSVCKKVWDIIPEKLDKSSSNKFRTPTDVMHQIFQLWTLCYNDFYPIESGYYGRKIDIKNNIELIIKCLSDMKEIMICVNDQENISEEEYILLSKKLKTMFEKTFPQKSVFEK